MQWHKLYVVYKPELNIPTSPSIHKTMPRLASDQAVTEVIVPKFAHSLCVTIGTMRTPEVTTFKVASVALRYPPNLWVLNNEGLVGTPNRWVGRCIIYRDVPVQE